MPSVSREKAIPPFILTLDLGSSSLRALLYDAQARAINGLAARFPYQLATTAGGGATLEADDLLAAVAGAIDQVLAMSGPQAAAIGGVAMDTLVSNVLGVDGDGRPLTSIYTYADTCNAADATQLRREVDPAQVHQRTGCMVHSSYLPARLRWLGRTQPDLVARVAQWRSFGAYLSDCFLGRAAESYSIASWSGLLNRQTLRWDDDWLGLLSVDVNQLPHLVDLDQPLQGLIEPWSSRWPVLQAVPWFPAVGDGAAANVGSGCTGPDRVALTIGTSGAMRLLTGDPISSVPAGLWHYRLDRRRSLLGGATSEGGNVFAWLREILRLPAGQELEAVLARTEPAGSGLVVLPFLAGERSPGWRGDARATISGLTLNTHPIEILRAGLEAVAYRFALIQHLLAPYLADEVRIIASGAGLLSSPAWLQILADVLGQPLTASAETETTSRGTALLALEALGAIEGINALPAALGRTYAPDAGRHRRYRAAIEAQVELYGRVLGQDVQDGPE
jgi:gluconokinase